MTLTDKLNLTSEELKSQNDKVELDLRLYSMMKHEIGNIFNPINIFGQSLTELLDFHYFNLFGEEDDSKYDIILKQGKEHPEYLDTLKKKEQNHKYVEISNKIEENSETIMKIINNVNSIFHTEKPNRYLDSEKTKENLNFSKEIKDYFKKMSEDLCKYATKFTEELTIGEKDSEIGVTAICLTYILDEIANNNNQMRSSIEDNLVFLNEVITDDKDKEELNNLLKRFKEVIPKYIHIAKYAGDTMLCLFNGTPITSTDFDLNDLINFTQSAYNHKNNNNIKFTLQNNLSTSKIKSHEGILYHILNNALKNAYEKQSEVPDSEDKYVSISVEEQHIDKNPKNSRIVINITNTGVPESNMLTNFENPGISSKDKSHSGLGTYIISTSIGALGGTHEYIVKENTTTLKIELPYNVTNNTAHNTNNQ